METSPHRAVDIPRRRRGYIHDPARLNALGSSRTADFRAEEPPARPRLAMPWAHVTEEPPEAAPEAPVAPVADPDCATMMLLHCLFAMVFAAAVMGLMHCLGFVVRSSTTCPVREGTSQGFYATCEMWQDARSVLSFVLGAVLCCVMTRNSDSQACPPAPGAPVEREAEGCEKLQLYACLL